MAEILVLAEHDGETVKKVTTELLTLARAHGEPAVVWTGDGAEGGRARLAEFGAAKVYVADSADYADYLVAPKAELLAHLMAQSRRPPCWWPRRPRAGRWPAGSRSRPAPASSPTSPASGDGLTAEQSIFGGAITVQSRVTAGHADHRGAAERGHARACRRRGRARAGQHRHQRRSQGGAGDRQGRRGARSSGPS